MRNYLLITYSLQEMSAKEKVRFCQALLGRNQKGGVLKYIKGQYLGKGVILVPLKSSTAIHDFFSFWKIRFRSRKIRMQV